MRIVIVDDHELLRRSVVRALEGRSGIEVVGAAGGGVEGLQQVAELLPDVALVDVNMPDMRGPDCARTIKDRFPNVVVVAWSGEMTAAADMLDAGASGYLLKGVTPDRLVTALKEIADHDATGIVYDPNDRFSIPNQPLHTALSA